MSPAITVQVNGEARRVEAGQSLRALLDSLDEPYRAALVEHNHRYVRHRDLDVHELAEGDTIEVILPAFGG